MNKQNVDDLLAKRSAEIRRLQILLVAVLALVVTPLALIVLAIVGFSLFAQRESELVSASAVAIPGTHEHDTSSKTNGMSMEREGRPGHDYGATENSGNPTMGELHEILVPAGFLVEEHAGNMAWKRGNEAIYFEVHGTGDGQYFRELRIVKLYRNGEQVWSSSRIRNENHRIYVEGLSGDSYLVFDGNDLCWKPQAAREFGEEFGGMVIEAE